MTYPLLEIQTTYMYVTTMVDSIPKTKAVTYTPVVLIPTKNLVKQKNQKFGDHATDIDDIRDSQILRFNVFFLPILKMLAQIRNRPANMTRLHIPPGINYPSQIWQLV